MFPLRPLGSTVITRFIATTGRSDFPASARSDYFFSARADLPSSPIGWPGSLLFLNGLSDRAALLRPRRARRLLLNMAWTAVLASPPLKGWPLPISVTRLNEVRLRYGSVVCSTGL
jgi:hypothetical protein